MEGVLIVNIVLFYSVDFIVDLMEDISGFLGLLFLAPSKLLLFLSVHL